MSDVTATTSAEGRAALALMRRRRVRRQFLDEPVSVDAIRQVLQAARWASSAGNRRIHRFLVVRDPVTIARVKPFAPGILASPPALVILSTDLELAAAANVQVERDMNSWIDVGTALMSMMLAAEAIGLGSCPATSFSRGAVARVLDFPPTLVPELLLQLGHPVAKPPTPRRTEARRVTGPTIAALTDWERLGQLEPAEDASSESTGAQPNPSTIQPTR